jgi:hypothetical protein
LNRAAYYAALRGDRTTVDVLCALGADLEYRPTSDDQPTSTIIAETSQPRVKPSR